MTITGNTGSAGNDAAAGGSVGKDGTGGLKNATTTAPRPTQLSSEATATRARFDNGSLYCWGQPINGHLGLGSSESVGDDETPGQAGTAPLGAPVQSIFVGDTHVCALLDEGRLRCWGSNSHGQLGYSHMNAIGNDVSLGTPKLFTEDVEGQA